MSTLDEHHPPAQKKWTEPYRHEVITVGIGVILHIVLFSFLWEYLAEHFGKALGLVILISSLLALVLVLLLPFFVRKLLIWPARAIFREMIEANFQALIKDVKEVILSSFETMITKHDDTITPKIEKMIKNFEDDILSLQSKQEFEEKFERMKQKYKQVHFKDLRSTNEFNIAECHTVKVGLMKGVQDCLYAIHQIEDFLPRPGETPDDSHYFEENVKAFKRIELKHAEPGDREDFNIHRIFVISGKALKDPIKSREIKASIGKHCAVGFDIKIALKERLEEPPTFEFGIYDNEIVFRLSINFVEEKYGDGIVYFNDAVLKDVYRKRFDEIEIQSLKPDDFWEKYPISS